MNQGRVSRPGVVAALAHLPFVLAVLLLPLLTAPTATAATAAAQHHHHHHHQQQYSQTASILRYLDTSAVLDGRQEQQQPEPSITSQVAACAKSLQQPPSQAFAAKAIAALAPPSSRPVANGPAFLVVISSSAGGDDDDDGEAGAGIVEATLRIHGVGAAKQQQQQQQQQQQHGLRGVVGSHLLLRDDDEEGADALGLYAPTPECAAASQSVSHLYAHGRIPHYVISVAAQQQAGRDHPEDDKEEDEHEAVVGDTGDDSGRLCAESREGGAEGTMAVRVCVDHEARMGRLNGTVTNVGTAPLCGAAVRVLAPLGVGPHRHAGEGPEGNHHHEAKRLSRAVPLFEQGAPPMGQGEAREFVVEVDREAAWAATAVEAIYGLLIDPDYDSCADTTTTTTPTTINSTTITPSRRLDTAAAAAAVSGASNADIRVAKREARKRRKEARLASKGVDHKLKKLKKVKKVGGMVVKAGTRKWRWEEKKKARLAALAEKKRLQQQKGVGLAAVGNKGLVATAADGAVPGVRVGTLNGAVAEGDKGLWFFRVPGLRGAKRWGIKQAVRTGRQALRRVHAQTKGKGKPAPAIVHLV